MNHHGTQPMARGGQPYAGNTQFKGNGVQRSCGRCGGFEAQDYGRGSHSKRYGYVCSGCTALRLARQSAQQQAPEGTQSAMNIVPAETVVSAVKRALALDPANSIEAACAAAAQALCQPVEAVLEAARQAGLIAASEALA